jgi:multiple sugar transport system ATP-binding protein
VTHDQVEAMTLGQRVSVMRDGRIQQVDTPQVLYARPSNLFVASFIGSPAMNLVESRFDGGAVEFGGLRIPLADAHRPAVREGRIVLGIRPESFEDAVFADTSLPTLDVDVAVVEELGSDTYVIFAVDAPRVAVEERRAAEDEEEALIGEGSAFTARVTAQSRARTGAPLRLAVNPAGFHFFDPDTGERLATARAESPAPAVTG